MDLVIIDSGGANLGSVCYALERLGVRAEVSADAERIQKAEKLILPGVGAAGDAMQRLRQHQLVSLIPQLTQPVLGICLGLQLMYSHSEENDTECLGIFPGLVRHFPRQGNLRVPHMGWNQLAFNQSSDTHALIGQAFIGTEQNEDPWAYFVHSYYAPVDQYTVASSIHGIEFTAIAQRDNFLAAQFHPERSAAAGAELLQFFLSDGKKLAL